ncbi:metacaspase 9 [Perilla frutescens var. hirtella]|nr:metacaspase 9 [Perilla frutescens var. hirtella]
MVAQRMGSQGRDGNSAVGIQIQNPDLKSNQLSRQGSLYSLTLDEVQNHLGDLGKPLSSMNLDELLKTVLTVEANNQTVEGVEHEQSGQQPCQPASGSSLNRQSSVTLSRNLSKKTVDEVWNDIQQEQKRSSLDRNVTLGEMTLEDFLVKAGVVAESSPGNNNLGSVIGEVDLIGLPQQAQWTSYSISAVPPQQQQQQQQSILPVYVPGHAIQQPIPLGGNSVLDTAYPETQIISSSPLMGTLSDTQTPRRKRVASDDVAEKSVERRQKRMIKNRESAARSRARKQAYTHELEHKVSQLEEENERLKRQQKWEKVLPSLPPPQPKFQLRRTSSGPILQLICKLNTVHMEKGKKLALLVGCNYPNTPHELHGCHNDVLAMHEVLISRFGFNPNHLELLIDKPGSPTAPTGANIKKALNSMVDRAEEGDILFFHYSGHGTLIKPHNSYKKEEEAIVPCDFNLITSMDFRQLVNRVPKGATFTILSDSCHSGGLIDKETEQIGPSTSPADVAIAPCSHKLKLIPFQSILQYFISLTRKISTDIGIHLVEVFGADASLMFQHEVEPMIKPLKADEGILLSGCQTNETSADVEINANGRKPCGAFSNAVQVVLKENAGPLSNKEVVMLARKILVLQHFNRQHPCLYCSDENAESIFLSPPQK